MQDKHYILRSRFGYDSFRPGQEEAIDAILDGQDILAVMPTGAGKSLCYQIPAMLLPGMTIVISPLISLMKDQVNALRASGCPAAYLNSSVTQAEYTRTVSEIRGGRIKLLYIAPERLQRANLPAPAGNEAPPLVVIDEAHCVSHWGHDFRTSYLEIADFVKGIDPRPITAAFTATATPKVKEDIGRLLRLREPLSVTTGFDRPNLYFEVQKPGNKKNAVLEHVEKQKELSGIVYCSTRKAVDELHELLLSHGFAATRYHAGLSDGERRENQDDFLYDRKTVMIATNAFGMGIDKSNVSYVIHYNMPKNIESYYQEAGRAGRDGTQADCILLYSGQDVRINDYLISGGDDDGGYDPQLLAHNRELLRQMTFYATGNDCLRRRLLSYFGEESPKPYCGNCSSCLAEYEDTDITLDARKIISCVYRLKQRSRNFGKTMIIDILRGGKGEKIKRFDLDSLSVWGIMAEAKAHYIRTIIDFLLDDGCLVSEGSEYPVVVLGHGYEAVLMEERRLYMKLPKDSTGSRDDGASGGKAAPKPGMSREDTAVDLDLLETLKDLRRRIAASESIPAYIVFTDACLRDMSRKKPTSLTQFSEVKGVGATKLEKYGESFVRVIRENC
ncbi:MAG: DNA helicase RecQ [Treponema sp.]|nr:DNA helicase RecQ [Treponema sp.]